MVSEQEKHDWKFSNSWFDKKTNVWFAPNNNPVLPETLKFLLTTGHVLGHWSTDKMIAFMNQYWWRIINKATETAYLLIPLVWNTAQKNLFVPLPGIFNCLMNNSRSVKWILYNFLCVMDINIFTSLHVFPKTENHSVSEVSLFWKHSSCHPRPDILIVRHEKLKIA